jgi:hypothetical protein
MTTPRRLPPLNSRQRAALNVITEPMRVRAIAQDMGRILGRPIHYDQAYSACLGLEKRALAIRDVSVRPARFRLTNSGIAATGRR